MYRFGGKEQVDALTAPLSSSPLPHRSPDFLPPSQTQVHKMRMAPSGRLLFVFTNRGACVEGTLPSHRSCS